MAEPQGTYADFYTNTYMQTHYQRYQLALQMAQGETLRAMEVAQLLDRQIRNLQTAQARVTSSRSMSEFEANLKILSLENNVENAALQRQITVINNVEKQYNIDSTLPSMNQSADDFGAALIGVSDPSAAARRYANQITGYSKGSDGANAVAAATFGAFQAAAYRKGGSARTKFDANRAKIKAEIAKAQGVQEVGMDTWQAQKDKEIASRLSKQGGRTLTKTEITALKELEKDPQKALAKQRATTVGGLEAQKQKLLEQQKHALQVAQQRPEQTMMRAQTIYSETMSPMKQKDMALRRQSDILRSLPPEQKMMALGFERVTAEQGAALLDKSYAEIEAGSAEAIAQQVYYAALKDRMAGKPVSFKIHEKVYEMTEDTDERELALGYILRMTEAAGGKKGKIKGAEKSTAVFDAGVAGITPGLTKEEKRKYKYLEKQRSNEDDWQKEEGSKYGVGPWRTTVKYLTAAEREELKFLEYKKSLETKKPLPFFEDPRTKEEAETPTGIEHLNETQKLAYEAILEASGIDEAKGYASRIPVIEQAVVPQPEPLEVDEETTLVETIEEPTTIDYSARAANWRSGTAIKPHETKKSGYEYRITDWTEEYDPIFTYYDKGYEFVVDPVKNPEAWKQANDAYLLDFPVVIPEEEPPEE
jgi:hypothetical protein